ncbi:diguanylate cyclase (GGDEF)-like protein [Desulfosalsimonas propionicica]|uniref:diguanylate cyclase n=1 Tax=Desulfosalsimonas propionicica TaxID=332175 RepID=A0A7W0CA88_9BACT|nr:sensor domain-containing diguanylate cyclase [Desulfosalsimonas propionicica]MBA2882041.1 diguanylate cyclase (GGDEF)-like protein [Desulfosalsimonas propionicica]
MDSEIELLRAMVKALPDPVFVITESGHYLEIAGGKDPAYYHDGDDLKGLSLYNVMPKDKADWFLEQIRKTLAQNRLRTVQYTLSQKDVKGLEKAPGPDGDIHFEGRIQPLPVTLQGERTVVWSARNITSQHELEIKLQRMSETDALTGIFNRRKFLEQLNKCFRKFKRYDRPTALITFDIDHFKRINDSFGHSTGDKVLCRLTQNCTAQLRQVDSLYRIGGEEFAVLLPETNAENAYQQAERLRQISEQLRMEDRESADKITISVGISEFADTDASIEDVMKRADACLYEAKRNGRNRVVGG